MQRQQAQKLNLYTYFHRRETREEWIPAFAGMTAVSLLRTITLTLTLLIVFVGCGSNDTTTAENGKINVVATTQQIGDAVTNIAGDTVNLTTILGPGQDPHTHIPREGEVQTFSEANVIFYNGLNLEAQMNRIFEQMASTKTVVSIGDSMPEDRLLSWEYDNTKLFDPHIWNDTTLWKQGVELIRDTLVEADPDNAATYQENAETYLAEIDETHAYVLEQIGRIPAENRVMVTAHDAFGYFGNAYDIAVVGLQGISTESEASTADVRNLTDMIVEQNIPALFIESSINPRTLESVIEAAKARGHDVIIGGELYSDALGEPGSGADTYTGMLRHNAKTLADALSQ